MHEVPRMIVTLREIFMSKLCSIKSLVYASMIARAFVLRASCVLQEILCILSITANGLNPGVIS